MLYLCIIRDRLVMFTTNPQHEGMCVAVHMSKHMSLDERRLARAKSLGIIVDAQDEWLLQTYMWHLTKSKHVRTNSPTGGLVLLHHCIVGKPIRRNVVVDHIDGNPLNNQRSNLRYATVIANAMNRKDNRKLNQAALNALALMRALRGEDI